MVRKDAKNTQPLYKLSDVYCLVPALLRVFLRVILNIFFKDSTTILLNDLYNRAKFLKNMYLISNTHFKAIFVTQRELGT